MKKYLIFYCNDMIASGHPTVVEIDPDRQAGRPGATVFDSAAVGEKNEENGPGQRGLIDRQWK
jgi:hypothetical protein